MLHGFKAPAKRMVPLILGTLLVLTSAGTIFPSIAEYKKASQSKMPFYTQAELLEERAAVLSTDISTSQKTLRQNPPGEKSRNFNNTSFDFDSMLLAGSAIVEMDSTRCGIAPYKTWGDFPFSNSGAITLDPSLPSVGFASGSGVVINPAFAKNKLAMMFALVHEAGHRQQLPNYWLVKSAAVNNIGYLGAPKSIPTIGMAKFDQKAVHCELEFGKNYYAAKSAGLTRRRAHALRDSINSIENEALAYSRHVSGIEQECRVWAKVFWAGAVSLFSGLMLFRYGAISLVFFMKKGKNKNGPPAPSPDSI